MPVAVMLFMSHRLECPEAQLGQRPQAGTKPNTTWSPGATENTPAPTSMTTPAPSWPPIVGSGAVAPSRSPVRRCSSLWHIPEACDLDQHLPGLRRIELDLLDAPRRVELAEDGGLGLHRKPPVGMFSATAGDVTGAPRDARPGQDLDGPAHDLDVRSRAVRRRRGAAPGRRGSSRRTAGGRRARVPSRISWGLTTTTPSNSRPLTASGVNSGTSSWARSWTRSVACRPAPASAAATSAWRLGGATTPVLWWRWRTAATSAATASASDRGSDDPFDGRVAAGAHAAAGLAGHAGERQEAVGHVEDRTGDAVADGQVGDVASARTSR